MFYKTSYRLYAIEFLRDSYNEQDKLSFDLIKDNQNT